MNCLFILACWECHSWHLHERCHAGKSTLLLRPLISTSSFQVPWCQCLKPISLHKTKGYFLIQLQIHSLSIQFFYNSYITLRVLINHLIISLRRISFSGDIQAPPGQGPVQPAVGDPASTGGWTGWPTEVPSNPWHSVILWFCGKKKICSFSPGEIFCLPDWNMGTCSFL